MVMKECRLMKILIEDDTDVQLIQDEKDAF